MTDFGVAPSTSVRIVSVRRSRYELAYYKVASPSVFVRTPFIFYTQLDRSKWLPPGKEERCVFRLCRDHDVCFSSRPILLLVLSKGLGTFVMLRKARKERNERSRAHGAPCVNEDDRWCAKRVATTRVLALALFLYLSCTYTRTHPPTHLHQHVHAFSLFLFLCPLLPRFLISPFYRSLF